MVVAIRSEMDSRQLLYPLMRVLNSIGTLCVISSNQNLRRLIEGVNEGGFRNITVIVDTSDEADLIIAQAGVYDGRYDFVILDNIPAMEYDKLLVPITGNISEAFKDVIVNVITEESTELVRFGSPARLVNKVAKTKEADSDPNPESKWVSEQTDDEFFAELLSSRKSKWVPFASYTNIELLEGEHKFYPIDRTTASEIFRIFKDQINMQDTNFYRMVGGKDNESSGYIPTRITG